MTNDETRMTNDGMMELSIRTSPTPGQSVLASPRILRGPEASEATGVPSAPAWEASPFGVSGI